MDDEFVFFTVPILNTRPVKKYGIALSKAALEGLRDQYLSGSVPFQVEHDAARRLDVVVAAAEIVELEDDGGYELKVTYRTTRQELAKFEERQGFSAALIVPAIKAPWSERPLLTVIYDPATFDYSWISRDVDALDYQFSLNRSLLFQFSDTAQIAKLVFEVAVGIFGSAGYDLLKIVASNAVRSIRKSSPDARTTSLEITFESENLNTGIFSRTRASVTTSDENIANRALDLLPSVLDGSQSLLVFNPESEDWIEL